MIIKVKKVSPIAKIPERQTEMASGFDLSNVFWDDKVIEPGARLKVPTGLCFEIPEGYEGQVRPRSGLSAKFGIVAAFGTIDSDYRGEVAVTLYNNSFNKFKLEPGTRVAQIVFCPVIYPTLEEVNEIGETNRGDRGFGSTGL